MALAPSHGAPLRVPVELGRDGCGRWFRLGTRVAVDGMSLSTAVPDEADGPLAVAFVLPGGGEPIRCRGRAVDELVGEGEEERAERRGVAFLDLDEAGRARIEAYITERLSLGT